MRLEVKRRLYVSVVTVFTGALLLSPLFVMRYYEALSDEMFEACIAKLGFPSFDHCSQSTISAKLMSVWVLLIPYAPAILLLYLNWLLRPDLRLAVTSYPSRTVRCLLWFGMFVSTAVILVGLWAASTGNIKEVDLARTFTVPLLFAPPLAAPLLFDYLVSGSNIFDGRF